jgi:hypothetical protein
VRTLTLAVWLVAGLVSSLALAAADAPAKIYEEAQKEERAGHIARAYLLYSQAVALDPLNPMYRLKSQAVQSRAAMESPPKVAGGAAKPDAAPAADVKSAFDELTPKDRASVRTPQEPPELKGVPGLKDFDLREDAKGLWQQVAHAFGLETVFDQDYTHGPKFHFQLDQMDYRQALHAAEVATGSFIVPISRRLFLVVKDTEAKRRELERTVSVSVPIPQATTAQELIEIGTAMRQVFTLEHIAWDSQQNVIVLRDRVSKVFPAHAVLAQLLHHRPQVNIEVTLIEVDRTNSLAYGVDLPTSFERVYLGTFFHSPVSIPATVTKMMTFGGGLTQFGIGIADATIIANLSRSSARTLVRSEIRAVDGMAASMHVGEKFPVLTAGYYGPASSSQGGQVYTPPPSFTFEDLGINLKVTPHIHGEDEVTLDLDTEFKVLTGQASNGIPIISSRSFVSKFRLRESEWGMVAGLMTASEARTINGIAGLATVPILGRLFRQDTKDDNTEDVILVIKPTLLNLPADQFTAPAIWTGSDARPVTPL